MKGTLHGVSTAHVGGCVPMPSLAVICIIRVQPDPVSQLLRGWAEELIDLAALLEHCEGGRHFDALQSILHVVHLRHHISVLRMLRLAHPAFSKLSLRETESCLSQFPSQLALQH